MSTPSRIPCPVTLLAGLFALLLSVLALPAQAQVERCVRTVAEFNSAWLMAVDDPVIIKMATGTYDMADSVVAAPILYGPDNDIVVRGGYNTTCTARSENPGGTVLTHRDGGSLYLDNKAGLSSGALTLERLTFRGINETIIDIESGLSADQVLRISRVWFDQGGRLAVGGVADVYIDNSLFTRSGDCALHLSRGKYLNVSGMPPGPSYFDQGTVRNSTFADNAGRGLCVGQAAYEDDEWRVTLINNVFWGNADTDIRLVNPSPDVTTIDAVLRNNLYTSIDSNRALRTPPTGTLSSNPQFVNAAAGDWRLATTSPAINSGRVDANLLNQKDFEGNVRWYGDAPDRGAFESNIGTTATVLTVTNTSDSGPGSLRQALIDANAAPNPNRIHFAIGSTCGPRVITLASLLPTIAHPVVIDGYTQPGASRNTAVLGNNTVLCVVLNGANQITGAYGLHVATDASPDASVSIEGLGFSGHSIAAVQLSGGRDHRLAGVQVGGPIAGYNALPSGTGVRVGGVTEGVRIGGPEPGDRNALVHALGAGISVSGSGANQPSRTVIENNYIGTLTGGDVRGNDRGIVLAGFDNTVRSNTISNSASHGVHLTGTHAMGNRVTDNRIGIPASCATCANRGNGGHGVLASGGADGNRIENNRIAFSGSDGVAVTGSVEVTIRRNRFHDNAGIGIDLNDDGINYSNVSNTPPPVGSANYAQNKPAIAQATGAATAGEATGTLTSRNGWYRIDVYGAPACQAVVISGIPLGSWGQAQDWLGSATVQISNGTGSADGTGNFSVPITAPAGTSSYFGPSRQIMATATRLEGAPDPLLGGARHLSTSELGRCRSYVIEVEAGIFSDGFE